MKKRSKMTKNAIVISVATIFICMIMLIGSTFAWFTDRVSSGKNRINAGNLAIKLYHANNKTTKSLVDENTQLFAIDSWEPGSMVYENFEIENGGDLSLKYTFEMNIASSNKVAGTERTLADVLSVAVLDGVELNNREQASELIYNKTLANLKKENNLNASGATDKFAIVVYWKPSENDNDYNLSNGLTSSDGNPLFIELGVNLSASQNTLETDSFGDDYDEQVTYTEASTLDDYNDEIWLSESDVRSVKLNSDITSNFNLNDPTSKNDVYIDLNGHTLSTTADVGTSIAAIKGSNIYIKNGKLNLASKNISSAVANIGEGSTLTLENVELTSSTGAGFIVYGKNATLNLISSTVETVGMAISTNAGKEEFYGVNINIKDSYVNGVKDQVGTAMLINIPASVTIDNSHITGYLHGLVMRGGIAVVRNSEIKNVIDTETATNWKDKYTTADWGSGNMLQPGALVIGNKSNSYQYPTSVTLINTQVISEVTDGNTTYLPTVYIIGNSAPGLGASLKYDSASSVGEVIRGNEYVRVNGE